MNNRTRSKIRANKYFCNVPLRNKLWGTILVNGKYIDTILSFIED